MLWTKGMTTAAVRHGHLAALKWVFLHIKDNVVRGHLLGQAGTKGHLASVKFLFEQTR